MKRFTLAFFLLGAILPLAGQQNAAEVFAPFVSRLKATAESDSVVLSWRNSQDLSGWKLLYRYTERISVENLSSASFLGRVKPGLSGYRDHPPDTRAYYYAVLIEDDKGTVHTLFIPFRNITTLPVRIQRPATVEEPTAAVTQISARVEADSVEVAFRSSNPGRELLLFRSASTLEKPEDLAAAVPPVPLDPGTTSYRDYPIPGVDYYYAVVDAGLFKTGRAELVLGENATDQPVRLPVGVGRVGLPAPTRTGESAPPQSGQAQVPRSLESAPPRAGEAAAAPSGAAVSGALPGLRPLPLPYLQLPRGAEGDQELAASPAPLVPEQAQQVGPATAAAIRRILKDAPQPAAQAMEAQVLPPDRAENRDGEEYPLQAILVDALLVGQYQLAQKRLQEFLNLRRSADLAARGHFYLGQAYYFQGLYRKAFLEFLLAQDRYYRQVQPWLDACLRQLSGGG